MQSCQSMLFLDIYSEQLPLRFLFVCLSTTLKPQSTLDLCIYTELFFEKYVFCPLTFILSRYYQLYTSV